MFSLELARLGELLDDLRSQMSTFYKPLQFNTKRVSVGAP